MLIGERVDCHGAWQFPQGGLDPGESLEAGLKRELQEELSLLPAHYTVRECHGPYRYSFPPGFTKGGYQGQEQHYFRLRLLVGEEVVNVHTAHPEFRVARWIDPAAFSLAWVPPMKQEVYRRVFADFFGLRIA